MKRLSNGAKLRPNPEADDGLRQLSLQNVLLGGFHPERNLLGACRGHYLEPLELGVICESRFDSGRGQDLSPVRHHREGYVT